MPVMLRTNKKQTFQPGGAFRRREGLRARLGIRFRACAAATLLGFSALTAAFDAAAQPLQLSDCGEVALAEFSWPTARLVSAVFDRLLTDGFACAVTRSPASDDRVTKALIEMAGDGGVVVAPGLNSAQLPGDPRLRRGAPTISGAREGIFIPDWMQAAYPDIETLSDALRAADRFRDRGTDRARFWICPESWECHVESRRVAEELGFAETFEIVTPASGDALVQGLVDAHQNRRPWIGYFWTPSATVASHPMVELAAGASRLCEPSGQCREPFAPDPVVTVYGSPLDQRSPEAAAFLQRFSIPAAASVEALSWRARTNASIDQTADYLLARSPGIWRPLLPPAALAPFEQALSARITGIAD